jgi:hypothetical protein
MSDFHGYPITSISSPFLQVDCLATAGPRIVGLHYKGSQNLLADVASITVPTAYGGYHYLGGHRLWHAPESLPRSYIPDDEGLTTSAVPNGLTMQGRLEPATGIRKMIQLQLDPTQPRITLTHSLLNEGLWSIELAPWAITMFRLGGTAILPMRSEDRNEPGLLPDRRLSLWPYTHIDDPRLRVHDGFVSVRPQPGLAPLKIGTFNPLGWTAYWLDGILFRKSFDVRFGRHHPDQDCNAEIYCDGHFIELESLGPLTRLEPGTSVALSETWELYDSLEQSFLSERLLDALREA